MKSVRNKKTSNSSFLSNHDLLENFRNKSFKLITRQASLSELKQGPKKVSLIQKKNYQEQTKDNKQNDHLLGNRKIINPTKGHTQRQKPHKQITAEQQVQKVIKQLNFIYDQIHMDEIELKMILNKNIRKIKDIFSRSLENRTQKEQQSSEKELRQKMEVLNHKLEEQSKKTFKYKKECNDLKDKLNLYERQIASFQAKLEDQKNINQELVSHHSSQNPQKTIKVNHSQPLFQIKHNQNLKPKQIQDSKSESNQNQIEVLQKIIETQQELISNQMSDFEAQNQEFLRILKSQALQIEQMIMNKQGLPQNLSKLTPKQFGNDQRSTAFQSKYDSSTTFRGPIVNGFSQYNSPQRTEDLIAKVGKKKPKPGDFSICLY